MPLHGKIVVMKRSGGDGTEFPLTASCLFGRKPDCDIRIQLPQVSREHCRVDLNENKEVIVTNLSSANPTCVNGQAVQQSERLKHGDVITIIDRSFRFEYPPPPTPKKRSSVGGKAEVAAVDPHLKDGANTDNIQRSLEKTQELEQSKDEVSPLENKSASPFSDLYQMIKQSLDVKTPRQSSVSVLQTPSSKFCTPQPASARKKDTTPKKVQTPMPPVTPKAEDDTVIVTPKSAKKRRSVQLPTEQDASNSQEARSETPPRRSATPQRFTLSEAVEQIASQSPKSPRRRSKEATSPASAKKQVTTPKSSDKERSKKRKSEEVDAELSTQALKRKRVSFGGHLSPELFDKRLPPDSPLRKGATPRRSLSLYKPKQSLLRRASVIGLLQECELLQSPKKAKSPAKAKTPSPKKSPKAASPKTPSSAKKSPKTQSPKPKTPSPGKKPATPKKASPKSPKAQSPKALTPKSKSPSPGKKPVTPKKASPKSPKAQSPKASTPKSKSPSPGKKPTTPKRASPKAPSPKTVKSTPAKSPVQSKSKTPKDKTPRKSTSPGRAVTPATSPGQTPKVQGRFSVSRISTPSPVVEDSATPKIPLKRKSMKSATKTTPALKSAAKVVRRKSGVMRTSMKVMSSWADIVRFGKAKIQVGVPTRAKVHKTTAKKKRAGPKPQTPKRRLMDHVSTGHAASPATIVVGRAHRLRVAHPAGAPPKIITNTAMLRKNMKMDEDLTGLCEMFKTPKNEKRRSTKTVSKTPQTDLSKSIMEPSVLNTPEETGEMVVSPMSIASTVKSQRFNSEAVQRLLSGEESFSSQTPVVDMQSEILEQSTEMKVASPKTPKQEIVMPEGLTGVKRMMKTPKQKAEPIEDLRGKLLRTPKQKSEQPECLSAIKRIMKTPKEKAAPVEDLTGKLLKTPKQKIQLQEECLTGVKRIMKTPKEKAQPVDDLRGKLLKTPKQKIEQEECLSAVKILMQTPDQKAPEEPENKTEVTNLRTPKQKTEQQLCLIGVKRIMKTPKEKSEPIDDIRGKLLKTPKQMIEQQECLTGVKRIMASPKQKSEPVEDMVGVQRLMRTPKEKVQPVEENFGLKRLMCSPRLRGMTPVEDFEGLEELMKEPIEEQVVVTEESVIEEQQETISEQVITNLSKMETMTDTEESVVGQSAITSISPAEGSEMSCAEESVQEVAPKAKSVRGQKAKTTKSSEKNQAQPEETTAPVRARRGRKAETATQELTAHSMSAKCEEKNDVMPADISNDSTENQNKPARGRRAKVTAEQDSVPAEAEDTKDGSEDIVVPVRGRRGKSKAPAASAVKQSRGRAGKSEEKTEDSMVLVETHETSSEQIEDKTCAPESSEEMTQEKSKGRKITAHIKPEPEIVADANPTEDVQPEQPAPKKLQRGRRAKIQTEPPQPETEISVSEAVEDRQHAQSGPTLKAKKGRRAKAAEPEVLTVESQEELTQPEQTVTAEKPKRMRRGRTAEDSHSTEQSLAAVPEKVVDKVAPEETQLVYDASSEQAEDQTCAPEPTEKLSQEKTKRGKTMKIPQEPKITDSRPVEDAQPLESAPSKPQRGRRAKNRTESPQSETKITAEEDSCSVSEVVEDKQVTQPEPTLKVRKGRRAKTAAEPSTEPEVRTVENLPVEESQQELTVTAEKPKRMRRGRTAEASHSTGEDVVAVPEKKSRTEKRGNKVVLEVTQQINDVSSEQAEDKTCVPEPTEQMAQEKSKRGRQRKAPAQSEPEITEVKPTEDVKPQQSAPKKTQRGRRAKVDTEPPQPETEISVSEAVEEEQLAQSEPTLKGRRGRQAKATAKPSPEAEVVTVETLSVKETQPEPTVTAEKPKRMRRGRTAEDSHSTESLAVVPEKKSRSSKQDPKSNSVPPEPVCKETTSESVKRGPVKSGRAAKTPSDASEAEIKEQENSSKESSDVIEGAQIAKRSVKWNSDVKVIEVTPLKARRGRKKEAPEDDKPQNASNPEVKDSTEKTQPAKRARRGAKAAEESTNTTLESKDNKTEAKTRKGRMAKK